MKSNLFNNDRICICYSSLIHLYVHYTRTFQVLVIPQLRPKVVDSEQFPINKFPGLNFSSLTFFVFPDSHETSLSVQWMFLRILAAPLFSSFCPHCTPGFSRVMPSGKNIQKRAWLDYLHTWCFTHCFLRALKRLWMIFFLLLFADPLLSCS